MTSITRKPKAHILLGITPPPISVRLAYNVACKFIATSFK